MLIGRLVALAVCLATPTLAQAMPSGIPDAGGMAPVRGAPVIVYRKLVAADGLVEWYRVYQRLKLDFAAVDAEVKALEDKANLAMTRAQAAERADAAAMLHFRQSEAAYVAAAKASLARPQDRVTKQAADDAQRNWNAAKLKFDAAVHARTAAEKAYKAASSAWYGAFQPLSAQSKAREDALLNPLVPKLLGELQEFARAKGYGQAALPILPGSLESVIPVAGLRDTTGEFLAWRKARGAGQ